MCQNPRVLLSSRGRNFWSEGSFTVLGFSFFTLKSNYFMTAAFTLGDGSLSARLFCLCTTSVSPAGPSRPGQGPRKYLDRNLHRSPWSSCVDVPVLESEPWSGGWGRGGRGASCGLHFLWRENPARLSQEWKGIESLLFPFCPSGTAHRREYCQCFLELTSFWI